MWCVCTVVFTVVFTVCSLRVHCAFTVIRQRARKGASSALSEAQLGPFLAQLSSTQLSLAQTSSAQLGLQSQPSRRARAAGRGRIARASRARARHGCARQVGSQSWVAGAGHVAGRDRGSRAQSAGCGSLAGHRGCFPARRVPRKMSSRSVPQPPLVSELALVGPPSLPFS